MEFFEIAGIAEAAFFNDVYKRYMWAYLLIAGLVFAILYVFKAVALFTIAKREGYKNGWMAFIPLVNTYYVGVVSDKNKIYGAKPQYISLAAALVETAYVALGILYYVAKFAIFNGGYAAPEYGTLVLTGGTVEIPNGNYNPVNLPENLNWAWWVFCNLQNYVMYWVQLAYIVLNVFVLVTFFRTYAYVSGIYAKRSGRTVRSRRTLRTGRKLLRRQRRSLRAAAEAARAPRGPVRRSRRVRRFG